MTDVSVIVLTWNTADHTIECLDSLKEQTFTDFEVIVVDNDSRKEEKKKLRRYVDEKHPVDLHLIENDENLGFTGGNNVGIDAAEGEFVVLLNDDTVVEPGWLEALRAPMEKADVGITASKVMFYDDGKTERVQYAGGRLSFFGAAYSEGSGQTDRPEFNEEKDTFWAMGASFMVRKSLLDEMREALCEEYFIYYEEVDLAWRVNNLGYRVVYCPRSVVYHKGSVSMKENRATSKQDRLSMRNKYLTFSRILPLWQLPLSIPVLFAYDLLRVFKKGPTFLRYWAGAVKSFINTYPKVKKYRNGSLFQLDLR